MRTRIIAVERLEHIVRNAMIGGYGQVQYWTDTARPRRLAKLSMAMDCEDPFMAELHSRHSAEHGKAIKPLTVVLETRCRKCKPCLERRAMFWRARAFEEYSIAAQTYFGTLTIAPDQDIIIDAECRLRLLEKGVDFDRLDETEKFRERVKQGGTRITTYLKRIREGDVERGKPSFRYLLVAEAHSGAKTSAAKLGRPHWHILLHEADKASRLVLPDEWLRNATGHVRTDKHGNAMVENGAFLKRHWKLGFSSFFLAGSPRAAGYLCKYLTKESAARVRASFRYGGQAGKTESGTNALVAQTTKEEN